MKIKKMGQPQRAAADNRQFVRERVSVTIFFSSIKRIMMQKYL